MLARWSLGVATILDSLTAMNYMVCTVCTLASFGQSAPQEHKDQWQYRLLFIALSVFG